MTTKLSNPQYPPNKFLSSMQNDPDFLLTKCDGNTNIGGDSSGVDYYFNQETPYKFPPLIICDDSKRINVNSDVYQKYSDVIVDECGNRFNIRNLRDSAGILQEGYSRNIDLDSHLKNINFYNDKCFYDNWKMEPKLVSEPCNGLKRNEKVLVPDYTAVGRRYGDCIGSGECATPNTKTCYNTPPTDLNCETNIRKRYDFSHNKFKTESCVKPAERVSFKSTPISKIDNLDKYPNTQRTMELLNTINSGVTHDYYKFFEDTNCMHLPAQRLFNNNTSRKATPNHHNMYNIEPKYLK
jgi:hypothetical protein